jgi:hypothetical protein
MVGVRASPTNPNTTPHPHKTELLEEIDQFSCSNSTPIPLPIFGGHQKKTSISPQIKGHLQPPPILCSLGANTPIGDSALENNTMLSLFISCL